MLRHTIVESEKKVGGRELIAWEGGSSLESYLSEFAEALFKINICVKDFLTKMISV